MDQKLTPAPKLDLIQQLAVDIGKWFPELEGRSLGVSDARPTKDNLPSLPLVMVSFASELTAAGRTGATNLSQRSEFEIVDSFVVEFWLKSHKDTTLNGSAETPFWTYYSYEAIRDRLLSYLIGWTGPKKERIWYTGLGQETTEYAIVLVFSFQSHYNWCPDADVEAIKYEGDGGAINSRTFDVNICAPKVVCCPNPDCEQEEQKPCP